MYFLLDGLVCMCKDVGQVPPVTTGGKKWAFLVGLKIVGAGRFLKRQKVNMFTLLPHNFLSIITVW